jgi:hypothetical protein
MMVVKKRRNRLSLARNPLAYVGSADSNASATLHWFQRAPTTRDYHNWLVGAIWINTSSSCPGDPEVYMLVKKEQGVATWIRFFTGAGGLETLTGNTGGAVGPDGSDNIFVISDIVGLSVDGTPGINTLKLTSSGSGPLLQSLRGDGSTQVYPVAAGYIDLLGTPGQISVTEDAGNNKMTWSLGPAIATTYVADVGTATPNLNILNIFGGENTNTTGSGLTIRTHLDRSIRLPDTNAAGTEGVYYLGATCNGTSCTGGTRFVHNYGTSNTFIGEGAGNLTLTTGNAVRNTAIGEGSATALVDASESVFIGRNAGSNCTNCANCSFWGYPGFAGTSGVDRGCNGQIVISAGNLSPMFHNYPGFGLAMTANASNIFVGRSAGNFTLTGATETGNSGLGHGALNGLTTGSNNTGFGSWSLNYVTTGFGNTGIGHESATDSAGGTGLVTGSYNAMIGYTAGNAFTGAESNNVCINTPAVTGDNNTCRIGVSTGSGAPLQLNKTFIHGIRGITTGVADAINVLIDSAGQLGTASSTIRVKENVHDMGSDSNNIYNLRPVTFNYKKDVSKTKQYGLIAEEVNEQMPRLVVYDDEGLPQTVKYQDIPVLLLNELQKLQKKVVALEDVLKRNNLTFL